ncbi:uncharacterized protein LOC114405207 [Glycine soja]|uniref:uncharacterized protein n=1 Tax=Glycine max TaxID=3847 RepID=UPI0003DEBAE5|nr:uncharacterized protein LOC102666394 [Glycine max]XP_028223637.1 uncharacterized protein LOC114405207 [Glycine soja]|eukprot:XP_006577660.1 uncharacterized protein LOC102666394 [Glycine max]
MRQGYAWFKRKHLRRSIKWQTKTVEVIIREEIKAIIKVEISLKIKVKVGDFIWGTTLTRIKGPHPIDLLIKITESAIKNLEVQVGQLEENSNGNFVANTEKNPKEEYKQFIFPVDFVIMGIEEDLDVPLILGRPFMLIAKCVVDIGNGNLEMSVEDQKVTFNLFEAMKHPSDNKTCFRV